MKIIITGSLGHISKPLTDTLVQQGHAVTVISTKPEKQKDIEVIGATAGIGFLEDKNFLKTTFKGADAVYTMVPRNYYNDPTLDMRAFYRKIANNYVQVIEQSRVKRVVDLISIGAHLAEGSGQILAHYDAAAILDRLSDVGITFMRPTAFYYNLKSFIPVIKKTENISANYGGEDKIAWVSPIDIAAAISEEIVAPFEGRKVRYVASEEISCNDAANILGAAIGKPEMKWFIISDEQMKSRLEAAGMKPEMAAGLAEMNSSMHNGVLFGDYHRNRPAVLGKVKMKDFAKEFADAFNSK